MKKFTVFPGQFIITTTPSLISTVLGSCVAVCLWDRENHTSAMNHFLLPGNEEDNGTDTTRGLTATRLLVRSMINRQVKIDNVEAKVFGGCNSLYKNNDLFKIGERNIEMARNVLKEFDIQIRAQHIGGAYGRKIVFNTGTGKVRMRLLTTPATEINEKISKGFGY
jgi:chemotaxis protein CheD